MSRDQISSKFTSIGGQAVIEGVMMRSPNYVAVAVRKSNSKIIIKSQKYNPWNINFPILKKPILRGVVTLIESMILGMNALSFSAGVSSETEEANQASSQKLSSFTIFTSMLTAFVMGMGLFVALPHMLAAWLTGAKTTVSSANTPVFHLVDGFIKMCILVLYVYLISLMKDIKRVFQYHGAEHKSIYAFEANEELIVKNAKIHTTLHPRCGTSFLLFLVLISVLVFSVVFPLIPIGRVTSNVLLGHVLMIVIKIFLMLPVAGIAYEFIKFCACRMENPFFKILIWPGMFLQNLTTKEPDEAQLEVALASLLQVLRLEKGTILVEEIEISSLTELGSVKANVGEFAEAYV